MKIARLATIAIIAAAPAIGVTAPAAADPPVNTDGSGHIHHVWLGDGSCLELDSVSWDAVDSGMHRGANSSTSARGPWHGPCPS